MEPIIRVIVKIIYVIAVPVLRIIYPTKLIWENKDKSQEVLKKPCLIYSNHTGYSDGLFMTSLLTRYTYRLTGSRWILPGFIKEWRHSKPGEAFTFSRRGIRAGTGTCLILNPDF